MKLTAAGSTDPGKVRSNNEDAFHLDVARGLLLVADGMGGHASGEVASRMTVEVIGGYFARAGKGEKTQVGERLPEWSAETNALASAVRLANMAVFEAAQNAVQWQGMGTTVAAVLVEGRRLCIAHVGDSRVYLIRSGNITQLTDDHSLVSEQVKRDLITKDEAASSSLRNVLTRAVGIGPEVDVDLDELTLADGDILVLCSDGLTGMVSDGDLASVVTAERDPARACSTLIRMANENGGLDNITVIAARIVRESRWSRLLDVFRRTGR